MGKADLTLKTLRDEARKFADVESAHPEPSLYGVTDGKAVGTYLEHKFKAHLGVVYLVDIGSSAKGIDFPTLDVDVKVTSITQPQSSCPFKSARQKIYGLGYNLIVFVYEKTDDAQTQTGRLNILHVIFIDKSRTADFQTTTGLCQILDSQGNEDDLIAFMLDKNLPLDDIEAHNLAREILQVRPEIGYLTISNALQWRLQYKRVIAQAGVVPGVFKI